MPSGRIMTDVKRIVLIGAGNMATRLSLALYEQGYNFVQVYSRTIQSAQRLAQLLGNIPYTNNIETLYNDADLYLFSVSDNALPDLIEQMPANNALWVHTAGSVPLDVFVDKTTRYGVLYPMQTVSRSRAIDWSEVPIFIEANGNNDTALLGRVASSISQQVTPANSQQRQALHLAAVFACNFSNHMYAIAEHLLNRQGLNFDVMKLLIRETEQKAEQMSPVQGQTGPAVRNDINVMNKHLSLLEGTPEGKLYQIISENIKRYNNEKQE